MRGLSRTGTADTRDERGVIAPLTAILMVAMLGMAAFAVDTAMMYSEHAQLQNGADAAALAIAHSCARGSGTTDCQKDLAGASTLTGLNALDGVTEVVHAKEKDGTVEVAVQASESADKKSFSTVFARVLGIDTVDIRATAQAKFTGYSTAHVMPLAFSQCETDPYFDKGIQFFQVHGKGSKLCLAKASGAEIPGGFGWLVHDPIAANCRLTISIKKSYKSDNSSDVPADCTAKFSDFRALLEAGKPVDVLVPIFESVIVTKAKDTEFYIEAFALVSLQGWHFQGGSYFTPKAKALHDSLGPAHWGLYGTYVKKVSAAEAAVLGGPATYHARVWLSN